MFRSRNPALSRLSNFETAGEQGATYKGIAFKSLYFVALTIVSAVLSFVLIIRTESLGLLLFVVIGAPILALICSMIASFAPRTAHISGSLYAIFMGASVGLISGLFEAAYSGIIFTALFSTIAVFGVMTVLYATGVIRVGGFFKRFMISALIGIVFSQLIIFIISLFSPAISYLFYGNNLFSVLISCIMVVFASLFILMDLDRMTEIVRSGMDKKYEWMAAFGLLVTLIWLYMEFLRLFGKIASRKK